MSHISKKNFYHFKDSILTKYESIVLDTHDTLEDVLAGILEDDDMEDDDDEDIEEEDDDKENKNPQINGTN